MDPIIIIVGLAGLFLIAGAAVALVAGGGQRNVDERLEQFVSTTPTVVDAAEETASKAGGKDVADRLDRALSGRSFFGKTREKIAKADVKLRVSEYLVLIVLAALGGALLGYYLPKNDSMIMAAIEMRCSGISHSSIPTSARNMPSGTIVPTIAPALTPRNSITTARTVKSVWPRLLVASATAAATIGGWSVRTERVMPSGNSSRSFTRAAAVWVPKSLMATLGTMDKASTTAGWPLKRTGLRGGSTYPRSISTMSRT